MNSPPESTTPGRRSSSSASCGIEPSRTVQYKPMLDAALDAAQHPPRACASSFNGIGCGAG